MKFEGTDREDFHSSGMTMPPSRISRSGLPVSPCRECKRDVVQDFGANVAQAATLTHPPPSKDWHQAERQDQHCPSPDTAALPTARSAMTA